MIFRARKFLAKVLEHDDGFGQITQLVLHLAQLEGGIFGDAFIECRLAGRLESRYGLELLADLQVAQAKMVGGILAQGIAAHRHICQAGNGSLVVAHLVISEANLVLQRRLNLALVNDRVLIEIIGSFLVLTFLVIGIAEQQLNFVGTLRRRRILESFRGVGNQAIVVAFLIINLGHYGRHHGFIGVVLLGHGQVGAGGGVIAGPIAEVAGIVRAGVFILALKLLITVEEQASFFVVLLLEVAVGQLEIRFGPLVIAQIIGGHFLEVADGRLVVLLVEVELAQLKIRRRRARVGRVLFGKFQNKPFGIGMREVQATHGVVVLGIGVAVAGGDGAGLAAVHRLDGQKLPERHLSRAILTTVEQLQSLLKKPLVGGKNLRLLSLGSDGCRSTKGGNQRQPGK